ncbi:hypothetical protein HBI56_128770 [Parastagonospora nodorum]|uniref:Uncharacterized protein n=1 Tax=Phaeosphaeria nodorum (strain SN15 / ATCC MYA-4574 / FGSC 10173) TaxID=321614 RepID=A0A7U2F010_PHANO|nr:hypothetical protein HBH56_155130 [Parastagonospora nodorum]QRC95887.1 hypothetical protein JI435_408080 [Parastagonospora nodorum SN15]KAH3926570.1 hypothetical protein HBH54_162570 [Parastagonospora nodorum]KAH4029369.1 hypothetical protein HBI09_132370 [Parastagonospora nodorum]KAH4047736.1 hypothetical protein HBH49_169080 [Parastagonospora nodorum]
MSCILHRLGKVCTEHENKRFPLFSSEPLLHSCIGATRTQHKTQLFIPPFLFSQRWMFETTISFLFPSR